MGPFYGGISLFRFLKNAGALLTLVLITLIIIGGSLSGAYKDAAVFYELMKESSKFNVSIALV